MCLFGHEPFKTLFVNNPVFRSKMRIKFALENQTVQLEIIYSVADKGDCVELFLLE